jgi:glycosyltransferase involved in cell wall biosynthesis
MAAPLISCLMVTRPTPDRFDGLTVSVGDYLRQTHRARELVVVLDGRTDAGDAARVRAHIEALNRRDVRIVTPPAGLTLGALRNLSRVSAAGEATCQWDDDDRSHPERIARQLEVMQRSGVEAVCLQSVMQYFPDERRLYCTNYVNAPPKASPATLMCRTAAKIAYPEAGPLASRGEDTAVIQQLRAREACADIVDAPHLYVYVSHGRNTWNEAHHRMLAETLCLSQGLLRRREPALRQGLAAFDFDGPVTVEGSNGPAFTIA